MDALRFLWYLSWTLFRNTQDMIHCVNRITVFQEQSYILGNTSSHLGAIVAALPMPQSSVSPEGSVARAHTHVMASASCFSGGGGCQFLKSQDVEGSEDCLRLLKENQNVFPHIPTLQELIHNHTPLGFPLSKP